jgi:hypothetical protein
MRGRRAVYVGVATKVSMQSGSDISQMTTVYYIYIYIYKTVHPCSINAEFMLLYIYLKLCEVLNNLKTFFKNFIW